MPIFRSISHRLPALLLLGLIGLSSQSAWAHRFGVVLLAPLSGQQATSGKAFIDGFALATREQDGHAAEESDGHLGGLDSYLLEVDSRLPATNLDARLKRLMATEQPAFLTGIASTEITQRAMDATASRGIVLVEVAQNTPDRLTMVDGSSFSGAFERAYNYVPDATASRGYISARLISRTVRALDQNPAQDLNATRSALRRALSPPPE